MERLGYWPRRRHISPIIKAVSPQPSRRGNGASSTFQLSQELKPAPARGLDQETVRAAQAQAGKAGMERRTWLGPPGNPDHQGPRSEWRGFLCSLGKHPVLVERNIDILCRRGN